MASYSGTLSAAGDASPAIHIGAGEAFTYSLTESAPGVWSIKLEQSVGGLDAWKQVGSFIDDVATTTVYNTTGSAQYYRLRVFSIVTVTVDYTLDDISDEIIETFKDSLGNDAIQFTADGVRIPGTLTVVGTLNGAVGTGSVSVTGDLTMEASDDIALESADDMDLTVGGDYTDTVTGNYTSTVTGARTLTSAADTVIEGTGAGDDVILQAPFAGSRVYVNGGLTLVRATTAVSASTSYQNILGVTDNSTGRTITLEADMNLAGRVVWIKDEAGTAGTANAITITPESGTIDGLAGDSIETSYGVKAYYGTGTNWLSFYTHPGIKKLIVNGYAKVGADAGWVVGAATNVGRLATLPDSQTGSDLVIPLTGLPVGSRIIAFHLLGQIESAGGAVTLDADLRKLTAAAADITDASVATMTQISVSADTAITMTNSLKALAAAELVTTTTTYYLLLAGTTAGSTDVDLMGVVVHYRD